MPLIWRVLSVTENQGGVSRPFFERVSACEWHEKLKLDGDAQFKFSFVEFNELNYGLLLYDKNRNAYVAINKGELKFTISFPNNWKVLYYGEWLNDVKLDQSFFQNTENCPYRPNLFNRNASRSLQKSFSGNLKNA